MCVPRERRGACTALPHQIAGRSGLGHARVARVAGRRGLALQRAAEPNVGVPHPRHTHAGVPHPRAHTRALKLVCGVCAARTPVVTVVWRAVPRMTRTAAARRASAVRRAQSAGRFPARNGGGAAGTSERPLSSHCRRGPAPKRSATSPLSLTHESTRTNKHTNLKSCDTWGRDHQCQASECDAPDTVAAGSGPKILANVGRGTSSGRDRRVG